MPVTGSSPDNGQNPPRLPFPDPGEVPGMGGVARKP
jgi:hypothetical protein